MEYSNEDWRRIGHAVEANRSLRSFGIYFDNNGIPPPASFIDHLYMNETLKNINYEFWEDEEYLCSEYEDYICSGESRANHSTCI